MLSSVATFFRCEVEELLAVDRDCRDEDARSWEGEARRADAEDRRAGSCENCRDLFNRWDGCAT